jgi:hypothetical protein
VLTIGEMAEHLRGSKVHVPKLAHRTCAGTLAHLTLGRVKAHSMHGWTPSGFGHPAAAMLTVSLEMPSPEAARSERSNYMRTETNARGGTRTGHGSRSVQDIVQCRETGRYLAVTKTVTNAGIRAGTQGTEEKPTGGLISTGRRFKSFLVATHKINNTQLIAERLLRLYPKDWPAPIERRSSWNRLRPPGNRLRVSGMGSIFGRVARGDQGEAPTGQAQRIDVIITEPAEA